MQDKDPVDKLILIGQILCVSVVLGMFAIIGYACYKERQIEKQQEKIAAKLDQVLENKAGS